MCRSTDNAQAASSTAMADDLTPIAVDELQDVTVHYKPWEPVGNPMEIDKEPHLTRFLFQNPDGFGLGHELEQILEHGLAMQCDHLVLPETKTNTDLNWVKAKVYDHCRRIVGLGTYRAVMASTPLEYHTAHKPGGVLAVTMGKLSGRVLETGSDEFGRWVYTKFNASGNKNVTVIGIYQPCDQNYKTAGPTTSTIQQYSLLKQAGRHNPHRVRHHYATDLVQFVKECQSKGEQVCVGGDFNETLGDDEAGLSWLMSQCGLQDVCSTMHGIDTHSFNTHTRGSRCIDYILVDPELMDAVEACGYEPFKIQILGDHRGVYMDVNTQLFFGSDTMPLLLMQLRLLNSRKVNQIVPYFEALDKHLQENNWYGQMETLRDTMKAGTPDDALAERLDKRRIAGCQHAAGRLQKYPRAPYSPEIAELRNRDAILRSAISQFLDPQEDYFERVENLQLKLSSTGMDLPPTLEGCRVLRRQNLKQLRALERDELRTGASRKQHQNSLIEMYRAAGKTLNERAVRRIQRAEEMARVWKQCAAARGLNRGGGLSHVLVPEDPNDDLKTCQNWTKLDDPQEVKNALTERLQEHFGQSKDCNLTSPPLDITMDFEGTCAKAEAILTGTMDTSDMDEATQWLMSHLRFVAGNRDAIDHVLTSDDFQGKIKAWDERTSTSPFTDVHLGHAKAYYALHPLEPGSEEETQFEAMRDRILGGHLTLMNYALQFGYSYGRWQSVVNALLEKDPGSPKIHRLRVIHLYEWDYNLLLAVKWRHLLHHVCDNNLINPGCYGGMPGNTPLDPVFIREMEYELCRLLRQPMVHFDNDAKSCYDRIP